MAQPETPKLKELLQKLGYVGDFDQAYARATQDLQYTLTGQTLALGESPVPGILNALEDPDFVDNADQDKMLERAPAHWKVEGKGFFGGKDVSLQPAIKNVLTVLLVDPDDVVAEMRALYNAQNPDAPLQTGPQIVHDNVAVAPDTAPASNGTPQSTTTAATPAAPPVTDPDLLKVANFQGYLKGFFGDNPETAEKDDGYKPLSPGQWDEGSSMALSLYIAGLEETFGLPKTGQYNQMLVDKIHTLDDITPDVASFLAAMPVIEARGWYQFVEDKTPGEHSLQEKVSFFQGGLNSRYRNDRYVGHANMFEMDPQGQADATIFMLEIQEGLKASDPAVVVDGVYRQEIIDRAKASPDFSEMDKPALDLFQDIHGAGLYKVDATVVQKFSAQSSQVSAADIANSTDKAKPEDTSKAAISQPADKKVQKPPAKPLDLKVVKAANNVEGLLKRLVVEAGMKDFKLPTDVNDGVFNSTVTLQQTLNLMHSAVGFDFPIEEGVDPGIYTEKMGQKILAAINDPTNKRAMALLKRLGGGGEGSEEVGKAIITKMVKDLEVLRQYNEEQKVKDSAWVDIFAGNGGQSVGLQVIGDLDNFKMIMDFVRGFFPQIDGLLMMLDARMRANTKSDKNPEGVGLNRIAHKFIPDLPNGIDVLDIVGVDRMTGDMDQDLVKIYAQLMEDEIKSAKAENREPDFDAARKSVEDAAKSLEKWGLDSDKSEAIFKLFSDHPDYFDVIFQRSVMRANTVLEEGGTVEEASEKFKALLIEGSEKLLINQPTPASISTPAKQESKVSQSSAPVQNQGSKKVDSQDNSSAGNHDPKQNSPRGKIATQAERDATVLPDLLALNAKAQSDADNVFKRNKTPDVRVDKGGSIWIRAQGENAAEVDYTAEVKEYIRLANLRELEHYNMASKFPHLYDLAKGYQGVARHQSAKGIIDRAKSSVGMIEGRDPDLYNPHQVAFSAQHFHRFVREDVLKPAGLSIAPDLKAGFNNAHNNETSSPQAETKPKSPAIVNEPSTSP